MNTSSRKAAASSRVHTRDLPAVAGFPSETRYASRFLTRFAGFGMTTPPTLDLSPRPSIPFLSSCVSDKSPEVALTGYPVWQFGVACPGPLTSGSSEKFMSGGPKFSPFLPRRRRGAGKESEEPHIVPTAIRLNLGMGVEISILFSAPLRLRGKINTTWHP